MPQDLLQRIEKHGLKISLNNRDIVIKGDKEALTPERKQYLKKHKAEIIKLLQAQNPDIPDYLTALKVRLKNYIAERDELVRRMDDTTIPAQEREKHIERFQRVSWHIADYEMELQSNFNNLKNERMMKK